MMTIQAKRLRDALKAAGLARPRGVHTLISRRSARTDDGIPYRYSEYGAACWSGVITLRQLGEVSERLGSLEILYRSVRGFTVIRH